MEIQINEMAMDEKEKEILQQVSEIFGRYGIKSVTMDELARQLGISKKTLYQYFTDKNELVEKTVELMIERNDCGIRNILQKEMSAVEEMFEVYRYVSDVVRNHNQSLEFDLQRYYPHAYRNMRDVHRDKTLSAIQSNLKKGQAEGLYRKDFNVEIIAKLNLLRMEYFMHTDLISLEDLYSNDFFHEVFKYHIYGIISQKGLAFIQENYPEFINN